MVIRRDQMQALEVVSEAAYVESAVAYFERYDPVTAASAGRAQLQAAARLGLASARRYGLSSGPALQLYLELMATLGSGFDSDPQYEWLNPFLEPRKDMGGIGRSRLIHFHVSAYLEEPAGPLVSLPKRRSAGPSMRFLASPRWIEPLTSKLSDCCRGYIRRGWNSWTRAPRRSCTRRPGKRQRAPVCSWRRPRM